MRLYRLLSSRTWLASYTSKVLFVCFIGIHVPLIGLALSRFFVRGVPHDEWLFDLAVTLAGTLIGAAVTLLALHALLEPIRTAALALHRYREHGETPALDTRFGDEAGQLMHGVQQTLMSLDDKVRELDRAASTDALTGLSNRRCLMRRAALEHERARREGLTLSIAMLDLDHFKAINDEFGHATGDAVLVGVADVLSGQLRPYDLRGRIGGEEFCVVIVGAPHDEAVQIAERLRIAMHGLAVDEVPAGRVTVSAGVVTARADAVSLETMIEAADRQLYAAKAAGRDRVVAFRQIDDHNMTLAASE